ncbi:MAG: UDP-N-acetylmuramoyl-L-alanine--D-glutamate ligase [Bacteroidales bacterium]|jgi:UDP-N-acetylmuramoylalanine--D-glutamate ligase|nr:UDP-N-acetylmuramoyl-L-alanine--D-glutamate ligase [Bacteroidales bacterium]
MSNEKFIKFRELFPVFEYRSFSYKIKEKEGLSFYYTFVCGHYTFTPRYNIPYRSSLFFTSLSKHQLDILIFHIGMIELISYWKFACSPLVKISAGNLSMEQLMFWKKLYFNGLGEFFFRNEITTNQNDFMTIITKGTNFSKPVSFTTNNEYIVPIGGGKDSTVTLELLRGALCNITPLIINPNGSKLKCIHIGGFDNNYIHINRNIDPLLLKLNNNGFLNGHTPFSAMLAFVCILVAAISHKKYIALSNELSANENTIIGESINHQYSKSLEFENDFREYCRKYITTDIEYFSFLRISELKIAQIFSKLPYLNVFRSCNAGSKHDIWCGNCPKCLFTFIILSPFIKKDKLKSIFHNKNLFADTNLTEYFLELCGTKPQKPFECVGTINEVNTALAMYVTNNGIQNDDLLIQLWLSFESSKKYLNHHYENEILTEQNLNNLPEQALKAYDNIDNTLRTASIIRQLQNKNIAILGLGREGNSTYKFLRNILPYKTLILADKNEELLNNYKDLNSNIVYSEKQFFAQNSECIDIIFKTPGISIRQIPSEFHNKLTSQTDFFLKYFSSQTIGITGTKGKSTTSSLIHQILVNAGKKSILVGNIGIPVLDKFYQIEKDTVIVAELSAHQLEKITVAPKYAILLNIFQEHLDYYGSFEAYATAKFQIFAKQAEGGYFIYKIDDHNIKTLLNRYCKKNPKIKKQYHLIPNSFEQYVSAFGTYNIENNRYELLEPKYLLGEHNKLNISFAYEMCRLFDIPKHIIIETCLNFIGLPHRLEFVGKVDEIDYYNDSISTTPQSTIAAVKTLGNVNTIIIGGMDRGIKYEMIVRKLITLNVKHIAFVGEAGRRMRQLAIDFFANNNDDEQYEAFYELMNNSLVSDNYSQIITWAKVVTEKGKQCLLSPAAPSYDMFSNFEERGEVFKNLVLQKI